MSAAALGVALVALALSALATIRLWYLERRSLILRHTDTEQLPSAADSDYFLVRASFVNPASVARTVMRFGFEGPDEYSIVQLPGVHDFSKGTVLFAPTRESQGESLLIGDTHSNGLLILLLVAQRAVGSP